MNSLETIQIRVNQAVENFRVPLIPANLYDPISYTLGLGGKRLRPLLVMVSCDMFQGNPDDAVHPAIGLELFHNFTLLHDDIMDQAPLRRGRETVYKKWNSNIAILSGDTMFAMANREMLKTRNEAIALVGELFNNTAIGVCEGQQVDIDFECRDDVTIPEYLEMIRLKTAILLACSLKTGAIIAGASEKDQQLIYDAGISLGMAFQLKDDYLDTFGDERTFGKTPGGDILAGKKTFLYLKLLEKAGPDREKLSKLYSTVSALVPTEKVKFFTSQFVEKEIPGEIESVIDAYFEKALKNIDSIDVIPKRKTVLLDLIQSLVSREK